MGKFLSLQDIQWHLLNFHDVIFEKKKKFAFENLSLRGHLKITITAGVSLSVVEGMPLRGWVPRGGSHRKTCTSVSVFFVGRGTQEGLKLTIFKSKYLNVGF